MKPRYEKINDYYIQDNYTGQKLDFNQMINRLNFYERAIKEVQK